MFTDMVGYSALAQKNEALALELLEEHRGLVRSILPRHHGREIETAGDAFFVEFDSALEAVQCGVEIQRSLHERNQSDSPDRHIILRIGLHLGDVVHSGTHVQGDGVNIAARLEPLAQPGGICISEDVARQIRNKIDLPLIRVGKKQLKNIKLPVSIYRVSLPWEESRGTPPSALAGRITDDEVRRDPPAQPSSRDREVAMPLLETKLYVPRARPDIVPRRRLIEQLDEGTNRRLTLISAPAGFGKTTLLAEWIRQSDRCVCWVSLDESDNNLSRFWAYFIGALQTFRPDLGENTRIVMNAQMRQPHRLRQEALLTPLVNEIAALKENIGLVLDDYHIITNAEIHEGIAFLLEHLPPQMHLIMTSRADPPLPLPRFRARNQLNELRADDLRFTSEEAAIFLNQAMGLPLAADDIAALGARTEGWIVGLQFAALSMQGRDTEDRRNFITAFAGSHRYVVDYLAEEVFNTQPENVRRFLLHSSILERLCGPLCDAVTGQTGGTGTLASLERNNLFTVALDEHRQWYRYHHLFAEVLRQRLMHEHAAIIPELHRRASGWFEQNGFVTEAMGHALAGQDFEAAARLIEVSSATMVDQGETSTLLTWLDALPAEMVRSRPRLSLAKAWATVSQDRMQEAEECAADAERWALHEELSNAEMRSTLGEVAAIRATMAVMLDDAPAIVEAARKALEYLPPEQKYLRGLISTNLSVAYMLLGDLPATRQAVDEALRVGHAIGNQTLLYYAYICVGGIERAQGHLRRAVEALHKALEAAEIRAGSYLWSRLPPSNKTPSADRAKSKATTLGYVPIATLAHRHLADLLYEWNDLEPAQRHANLAIELGQSWWVRDEMIKSYVLLARVEQALGNDAAARNALKQAEELTDEHYAFYLVAQVGLPCIRQWLSDGFLQPAIRWGEKELQTLNFGPALPMPLDWPGSDLSFAQSYLLATLARLLLAQEKPELALRVLDSLLPAVERRQLTAMVIDALVLQALALQAREDMPRALDRLNQALSLAQPEGYVRTFVNEGEAMQALLRRVTGKNRRYAAALLGLFEAGNNRSVLAKARTGVVETPSGILGGGIEQVGHSIPVNRRFSVLEKHKVSKLFYPTSLIEPLSRRELELVPLLAEGLSNQEIARKLHISLGTVKIHLKHIYGKLDVSSRTQAVARARELNLF